MTMGDKIKEIVLDMDNATHRYLERNHILEVECQYENGKLRDSRRAPEFELRRRHVWEDYDKECTTLRRSLRDALVFAKNNKISKDYMPYEIIVGKGHLQYPGLDETISLRVNFPLAKPMWISDANKSHIVRMMLRLMLSLPSQVRIWV